MKPGLIACVVLAGLLSALPGCKKFDVVAPEQTEELARKKGCRVQKLKLWWYDTYREVNLRYNNNGDPTDMLVADPGTPGWSDNDYEYHWRYDNKGRVTDYYDNLRGNTGSFIWHRYFYHGKDRISDSMFTYSGNIHDPVPPNAGTAYAYYVHTIDLDNKGRIIRNTSHYSDPSLPPSVTNYTYNRQGNLVLTDWITGTPVPYDNKNNVYRSHKVWQQIYQDYSQNNALPSSHQITRYNEAGLPVKYTNKGAGTVGNLFGYVFDSVEVVYDCGKGKPVEVPGGIAH